MAARKSGDPPFIVRNKRTPENWGGGHSGSLNELGPEIRRRSVGSSVAASRASSDGGSVDRDHFTCKLSESPPPPDRGSGHESAFPSQGRVFVLGPRNVIQRVIRRGITSFTLVQCDCPISFPPPSPGEYQYPLRPSHEVRRVFHLLPSGPLEHVSNCVSVSDQPLKHQHSTRRTHPPRLIGEASPPVVP